MNNQCYWLLLLTCTLFVSGVREKGYCQFPKYLWRKSSEDHQRLWISISQPLQSSSISIRRKEIVVYPTSMTIILKSSCDFENTMKKNPCHYEDVHYKILCIGEDPGHRFRILKSVPGMDSVFSCIQFRPLNKNILQIFSALPKNINEDKLCHEEFLEKEEWPWIDPVPSEWTPCPLIGGYDFNTFEKYRQLCEEIWRPSRFESECIYGEGIEFLFPKADCNPFSDTLLEQHMFCWGDWEENGQVFVSMSGTKEEPKYIMRYPVNVRLQTEFSAFVYVNPSPHSETRNSSRDEIEFLELKIRQSHTSTCADESPKCKKFAHEGKCTNSALHHFANYCKKSCGYCENSEITISLKAECSFPLEYQGEWLSFDEDQRRESVTIQKETITFSRLGQFKCKSKHWSLKKWKVISEFKNGCRPRYTCIQLNDNHENILQYRIARSKHTDESFKMCHFKSDPYPLLGKIRGPSYKSLFDTSKIHWGSCGLGQELAVNYTLKSGHKCPGVISDWDPEVCRAQSVINLTFTSCLNKPNIVEECVAFVHTGDMKSVLITKSTRSNTDYRCWMIWSYPETPFQRPWQEVHFLPNSSCIFSNHLHERHHHEYSLLIQSKQSDNMKQNCHKNKEKNSKKYYTDVYRHDNEFSKSDKWWYTTKTPISSKSEIAVKKPFQRFPSSSQIQMPQNIAQKDNLNFLMKYFSIVFNIFFVLKNS